MDKTHFNYQNNMKKLIIIALLFASCDEGREPEKEVKSTNESYRIQLLFSVDGCKVYRFYDKGEWRYFANTKGSVSSYHSEQSGKTRTTEQHSIETQ
jgi:hypothetical protein